MGATALTLPWEAVLGDPAPPDPQLLHPSLALEILSLLLGIGHRPQTRSEQGFIFSSVSLALETGDPNSGMGSSSHPN